MPEISYPKEVVRDLIDGKLPWEQVRSIISGYKDDDRFDKYIEVLQEKVPWREQILLPLSDDLYIVRRNARIAQLVFVPVLALGVKEVAELTPSDRGEGGFGSTGV